ncbi:ATPase, T2SS/T4P/T4SS family, partial [Streptomyces cellulosae]
VLRALMEARLSFLVSGGTGTGKTTLLSALLGRVVPVPRALARMRELCPATLGTRGSGCSRG